MCMCRLWQFILKIQVNSSVPQTIALTTQCSNNVILYLAFFDIPSQIHWLAHMVAMRFFDVLCHLAFRAVTGNSAGPSIC